VTKEAKFKMMFSFCNPDESDLWNNIDEELKDELIDFWTLLEDQSRSWNLDIVNKAIEERGGDFRFAFWCLLGMKAGHFGFEELTEMERALIEHCYKRKAEREQA